MSGHRDSRPVRGIPAVHCGEDVKEVIEQLQTEDAIIAVIADRDDEFVNDMVSFGLDYAPTVRDDHRHFVEAFREGRIPGVTSA